jgi:DNA gyrase inhibitor GyrI
MSELQVSIVKLEPMRVASVQGFGAEPEAEAHQKLEAWAGARGYLDDLAHHRVFGFNNPSPTPGSPNYGYELWITVGPEVEAEGDARIIEFGGGLYAVTRMVSIDDPYESIPDTWKKLYQWMENSKYRMGTHQWMEEHLRLPETPAGNWSLDLYLPIVE